MAHEPDHELQIQIISALLFMHGSSFSELQKLSGLESNKITFHIKRLVEGGLVEKNDDKYQLTIAGKEFANRLDTDDGSVEKQPKSSVLLLVPRENNGRTEYLQQQRLKQPWFEYYVYITGKLRWGESIYMGAARELAEETGLSGTFSLLAVDHERDFVEDTGEVLEDKLFYVMLVENVEGELIQEFEGGRNEWMTKEQFMGKKLIDGGPRMFNYLTNTEVTFAENEYYFDKSEF